MKILYLDCGMGAAGDMLMAALISLLPENEQKDFVYELNNAGIPGVNVELMDDEKCGIVGKHIKVLVDGVEEGHGGFGKDRHSHASHSHRNDDVHGEESHSHRDDDVHGEGSHSHASHSHRDDDVHGEEIHNHASHTMGHVHSSFEDVEKIVQNLNISVCVKRDVIEIYKRIAKAESLVHGREVDKIHFHEVGMMDAVADITGCAMLMERLSPDRVVVSPVNTGYGTVRCAHGVLPVPAPATANLLRGLPSYSGDVKGELCTPTGAALIGYYGDEFSRMPLMNVQKIGYGTGNKDFENANVLRAILGEAINGDADENADEGFNVKAGEGSDGGVDEVTELKCNMDDMTAEDMAYAQEIFMENGAKDVFFTAVTMKKSRPGILLTVICDNKDKEKLAGLIFKHTSTIGIRAVKSERVVLTRREELVHTPLGDVHFKISEGYGVRKVKAGHDDLKRIANDRQLSIEEVKQGLKIFEKDCK